MADDVMEQIQKQLEGNTLGLTAVADVLQKMEARLEKAEESEYEEKLLMLNEDFLLEWSFNMCPGKHTRVLPVFMNYFFPARKFW